MEQNCFMTDTADFIHTQNLCYIPFQIAQAFPPSGTLR